MLVTLYFALVIFFQPHNFYENQEHSGNKEPYSNSAIKIQVIGKKESNIHKLLRHLSPCITSTQTMVVIIFWTVLWGPLKAETNPQGWGYFFDVADHSIPFLMIITDYISNDIHHPTNSFWLAVSIGAAYLLFQIIYQALTDDIIYDTPLTDQKGIASYIADLFTPLVLFVFWKFWEFVKFKILKLKGLKIERDARKIYFGNLKPQHKSSDYTV